MESKKREKEYNKENKGANKIQLKHDIIKEDWGEHTMIEDIMTPGMSMVYKEPTAIKGSTTVGEGATPIPPPTPYERREEGVGSYSATPKAL